MNWKYFASKSYLVGGHADKIIRKTLEQLTQNSKLQSLFAQVTIKVAIVFEMVKAGDKSCKHHEIKG